MSSHSSTLLPPYYPTTPLSHIDEIIIELWNKHLELELASPYDDTRTLQHLKITAAVIDFWEEKLTEINDYEIQQRRSNNSKHG